MRRLRLAAVATLLSGVACGPAAGEARGPAPKSAETALHEGPLTDFVPAAGLRWLAVARLSELAATPGLRESIALLFPERRLDAFARGSGIDLRKTDVGLAAGFDFATLYMGTIDDTGSAIETNLSERLVGGAARAMPHPRIRRIWGVVGRTPQTLVLIDGQLAALSTGSQTPARVVELFALGKLRKSPPALEGSALRALPPKLSHAPFVFYAPGPFVGEWEQGARGLLAGAVALGIAARPLDERRLQVTLVLAGDFPDDAPARLLGAWDDLGQSDMGRLLALNTPAAPPEVSGGPETLELRVQLNTAPLAQGLRAAVMAEVWEILDLPSPSRGPVPSSGKP